MKTGIQQPIAFGRALYFPYINFRDIGWLKAAALYYNGFDRMVPGSVDAGSLDDEHAGVVREFNEREEFVRNIDPVEVADIASNNFVERILPQLRSEKKRERFIQNIGLKVQGQEGRAVHIEKINGDLREKILRAGLGMEDVRRGRQDWIFLQPALFACYMTTLANTLAGTRQLPLITDDPIFQPLISGLQTEPVEQQDISMELASIVIKTVVPVNIESLPVKTIMKFREDYRDERRQFYAEINKLVGTFPTITHPDTRQRFLEERSEDIRLAVKDLRRAMKGIGLTTFLGMVGLTVPLPAGHVIETVIKDGVVAWATTKKIINDYQRIRANSPYSYVLS